MAMYPCLFGGSGGGGIPAQLQSDMNAVFNKKFGTTGQSYASSEWADDVNLMGLLPEKTASGSIASFSDGADDVPIKSGKFYITASQTGSGTPSPSNPRPIVGYTGMTIHRADNENPHVVDTTYPVSWQTEAGTVYGGYFNSDTGVLTVTHEIQNLDDLNWFKNGETITFYSEILDGYLGQTADFKCSCYEPSVNGGYNASNLKVSLRDNGTQIRIWIADNSYSTSADFKNSLTGQKITLPLATPVTYQLTAQEINTLLGDNNIWCDTGDCEVTYRSPTIWTPVLKGGLISTTSAYATASFPDISAYKYVMFKIYDTVSGTDYSCSAGYSIANIPTNSSVDFQNMPLHTLVRVNLRRDSISSVNYGGAYVNIYADVYVTNEEIFSL